MMLSDEQILDAIKGVVGFEKSQVEKWRTEALIIGRAVESASLAASEGCYRNAALEEAAKVCDEYGALASAEKDSALLVGKIELSNTMSGEPRAAEFLASAIRALRQPEGS
jgi:hypothetical protein